MRCWKCSQILPDGTSVCTACGTSQERGAPESDIGRALRDLYDRYGAKEVFSNSDYILKGLSGLSEEAKKARGLCRMALGAGAGRLYLEQLQTVGHPDAEFQKRIVLCLIADAGMGGIASHQVMSWFDEMIGWKQVKKAAVRRPSYPLRSKILGIDLGGSTIRAAVIEDGQVAMIPNRIGGFGHPSVVAMRDGRLILCEEALQQAISNPDDTILSFKQFMGNDCNVALGENAYSPQFLSALMLRKIKEDAAAFLGVETREAVIAVPNGYTIKQRRAVIDAGRMAGLDVKRLINNTSAALLDYGYTHQEEAKLLVCSMGSTSFDVSVVSWGDNLAEIIASGGDNKLGGDDFTNCIVYWILHQFKQAEGVDLREDPISLARVRDAAEAAKKELSRLLSTQIFIPNAALRDGKPLHFCRTLSRATFNDLTAHLREKARDVVQSVLIDAEPSSGSIGQILFVGGSSRIPAMQDTVCQILGRGISPAEHPDDCTARGAAVIAGILNSDVKSILLLEATTHSLGVETAGGVCTKLIKRNTTYPTSAKYSFSTCADNQATVDIHLLEGESENARENETFGKFQITGIPPAAKGVPLVEVTVEIDANAIVSVLAKDTGSGTLNRLSALDWKAISEKQLRNAQEQVNRIVSSGERSKD